jgi:hypothetical protein
MTQRRGVSLVELLLTMSACSVILTMSAALIHRVMHTQSKIRACGDVERSALRLSNAFRGDVRRATQAVTETANLEEQTLLRLQFTSGEFIDYRHSEGTVTRVHTKSGEPTALEAFPFPPDIDVAVRPAGPHRLQLTITSRPLEAGSVKGEMQSAAFAVRVALHVEATLSRDSSREQPEPGQEESP